MEEFQEVLVQHVTGGSANIYSFSLSDDAYLSDYEELDFVHQAHSFPEGVLHAYKRAMPLFRPVREDMASGSEDSSLDSQSSQSIDTEPESPVLGQ